MAIPIATDNQTNLKSLSQTLERASLTLDRIKDSLRELLGPTTMYESFESSWDEYEKLKRELETSFNRLNEDSTGLARLGKTGCVEGLCRDIRVELTRVQYHSLIPRRNKNRDRAEDSSELLAHYQRIQTLLQTLRLNVDPRTYDIPDHDIGLETLHVPSGGYKTTQPIKPDPHTHSTTRRLHNWMKDSPSDTVCWVPGTQRTAVSHALCTELDAAYRLGASFFVSSETEDFGSIVPSLAYQLASYSTPFRLALLNLGFEALAESPNVQFEQLIVEPLAKVRHTLPANLAIVLDVTHECADIRQILDTILAKSKDLPVKFFVFSRPEPDYDQVDGLFVCEGHRECVIEGLEGELRVALKPFGFSESQLVEFVQRAGVLFACAAAATPYVGGDTSWSSSSALFNTGRI